MAGSKPLNVEDIRKDTAGRKLLDGVFGQKISAFNLGRKCFEGGEKWER